MKLHKLLAVRATTEPNVYEATVDLTGSDGIRETCVYAVHPGDQFGLAPDVRTAVEAWVTSGKAVSPPEPVDLIAYAAQKRWQVETGGITVGEMAIATDDRSKSLIMGARMGADRDSDFTTQFKPVGGGFVTVDAAAIVAISDALLAHVADCFAVEANVVAGIGNGTITTTEQIDAAFGE